MVAELVDNKTKMKALRICQQYMGGSWMDIDENQFCIEHIRLMFPDLSICLNLLF